MVIVYRTKIIKLKEKKSTIPVPFNIFVVLIFSYENYCTKLSMKYYAQRQCWTHRHPCTSFLSLFRGYGITFEPIYNGFLVSGLASMGTLLKNLYANNHF